MLKSIEKLPLLAVFVPLLLMLQGCSGEGGSASLERNWLRLGGQVAGGRWTSAPIPEQGLELEFGPDELAAWSFEGTSTPLIEEGAVRFTCERGGRLESAAGLELDTALIDDVTITLDGGDARGTLFHLEWTDERGRTRRKAVVDKVAGMQTFLVSLRNHAHWTGRVSRVALIPGVGGERADIRIQSLRFSGRLARLAQEGQGQGEVFHAGQFRSALFGGVPSTYTLPIEVPEAARLHLGLGLLGEARSARFELRATGADGVHTLLERSITREQGWQDLTVSLEQLAGQRVELSFSAHAEGEQALAIACWSDPILRWGKVQQPNVFIYLADTVRADHLQPYGYGQAETPALVELAERGVLFEACIAQSNWTKSSVASMMTSTYVGRHGVPHSQLKIPEDVTTLAESFRARGYRTASFVTNRLVAHVTGLERGFSTLYDTSWVPHDTIDPQRSLPEGTLPWIESHSQEPLFVYVHTAEPHDPYDPPQEFRRPSAYSGVVDGENFVELAQTAEELEHAISLYDGELQHMDHALGSFVRGLEQLGLFRSSYFVFTSDHGESFREHGEWRHRRGLYEHQVAIPLIFHLPDERWAGTRRSDPVRSIDIMPTLLRAIDARPPESLQGEDLFGERGARGGFPEPGVLSEASRSNGGTELREWSYRTARWKVILIEEGAELRVLVYDLREDPHESSALSGPHTQPVLAIIDALRRRRSDHSLRAKGSTGGLRDLGYLEELDKLGYLGDGLGDGPGDGE